MPEHARDIDIAILLKSNRSFREYQDSLTLKGWVHCGTYDESTGDWTAIRYGLVNLMITESREFFEGYKLAMEVCRYLKLTNKSDRIAVCQIVRDKRLASEVKV